MVLKEFNVPANTVSDELLQLFITLLVKVTVHSDLRRLKGCPLAPANSSSLNKKQKNIQLEQETNKQKSRLLREKEEEKKYIFENFSHIISCSFVF